MAMKHPKRSRDPNQLAKQILDLAIGEAPEPKRVLTESQKFAQSGGLKGGKARAKSLSPARRREIAQAAAEKRWKSPKAK